MIALVLAMREEAQPLISHLSLQRCKSTSLFPVFHNARTWLTICGVGKANAAAAVTELFHIIGHQRDAVWLNIGIAGHPDLPIGTLRSAHSVLDYASGQRWYPPQVLLNEVASSALTSVDAPETTYPDDSLYDMEGAGFCAAALRCSTAEAVQCLKIVSDNREHGTDRLSPEVITELVASQLDAIAQLCEKLREATRSLRADHEIDPVLSALLGKHRFSVTQRRQLIRLAQRLAARAPRQPLTVDELAGARSSREVLRTLEKRIDALPVFPRAG
jgi:nucleoside phosphorylase